ncbi:MAG: ammonium transporter [Alphaproteobacteria bacterium]|nr:ammonium transporter [Alphaproteobacteria bacterium]
MDSDIGGLTVIFTEFYFWVTVVMMFLIHVGFCMYEVGATRPKNLQHTLMKNTMLIPLVTVTFYFFGWWLYFAFINGPWINGPIQEDAFTAAAVPWSDNMGPHMQDRINGVFWAAFLMFSCTTASIVSGAIIERARTAGFLIIAVFIGSITWIIDAAWGWSPGGWMVQLMGYHDAYASGVVHGIAGGTTLAVLCVLGPRIGRFAPDGTPRTIPVQNPWLITIGLFLIFTGFWGFYAACNIPILDIDGAEDKIFMSATNIYLMPTTLSAITFNFMMSLAGGLMAGYMVSKGDPFWSYSGGLCGIICASAGNDLYHPIQAMIIAMVGVWLVYKLHHWVERRFKIDDAVGACAVHGYGGTFGVIVAGFLLWGYPAAAPTGDPGMAWFGSTPEGYPAINPLGNFIGAIIMWGGLGFIPAYILAKVLDAFGLLRVPREVEIVGLDTHTYPEPFPYLQMRDVDFERIQRESAR